MTSVMYRKMTPLEHVLARPDTYIGSVETERAEHSYVVAASDGTVMTWRPVTYNPGLYKIVDEIIVNAIDQSVLDPSVDKIAVDVDPDFGIITVTNTGRGVPVEKIEEHDGVWAPELIFGHLLTSSNYDDAEERIVGGKNGLGAKLTNIYSLKFDLEIVDPKTGQKYRQTFENNMTTIGKPRISKCSSTKGYVKISFVPDLARFGLARLDDDDNVAVIRRRAWDASACTNAKVKVLFNGETVPVKTFEKYVDMFVGGGKKDAPRVFFANDRWDVAVAPATDGGGFRQVSFVNGIATTRGGTHVTHAVGAIVEGLRGLNAKKYADVKPAFVRDHMFVFVRATLVNPSFSSQTKSECTSKVASFGSRFAPPDDFLKKVAKLGIMEEALALSKHKETRQMSKSDGAKTSTIRGIPKLEDAVKAGTARDSGRCTLVVCEGDSAKTFCISGLSVVGRDHWGVYPLRGKLLNVRDASSKQILENQEIQQLKQILGLHQGRKYETDADLATLRYGRVLILTDADLDGSHIKGLLINLFEVFWPGLVRRGYLACMRTPILKATKKGTTMNFYTQKEFEAWKNTLGRGVNWAIKYYKGLGTSTAAEAREYFGVVRDLTTAYAWRDAEDDAAIELAFKKQMANARKGWIVENTAAPQTFETRDPSVPLRDFVNKELVHFSIADVVRSIPSVVDGLKPSQRKVMYGVMKKGTLEVDEIKVSQLAGYVAEVSAYHHGDASLHGTIVNMAQDFVGSNNVNLLVPSGQFGTRLQGGKDAASARYIFTKLAPTTRAIFDKRDDALLAHLEDDGRPIEPAYYVPTLPTVLINGAEGIGTGFSTSVPCYDPRDLVANIRRFVRTREPMVPMTPWYRGFGGTVEASNDDATSFRVRGTYVVKGARDLWITELPVGTWTQTYKEWLEDEGRRKFPLTKFENHSTETEVLFKLTFPSTADRDALVAGGADAHKTLNLSTSVHTSNMYLFDPRGRITLYRTPLDILREYCVVRLEYYRKRKDHLLKTLAAETARLDERIRFVTAVIDGTLEIFRRPIADVRADMRRMSFSRIDDLLDARVHEFTMEKVSAMERAMRATIDEAASLTAREPGDLWLDDVSSID